VDFLSDKDKALQRRVQQFLDNDKDLKGYGLKANVVDGEVQVSGVVDTLSEKTRLEENLKKMPGVKRLELGLAVSTDGAIDDKSVTEEVMEELNANPQVKLRHIGAKSVDGTVYLMGTVETPGEEQEAIKTAQKARGVTGVVSQLKIRPGGYDDDDLDAIFHHQVNNDNEDEGEARLF
jgi:hyperosmotically inducible protein